MKRKYSVNYVKGSIPMKRLARRLSEDLNLDSKEKDILVKGLGLAWVAGAHMALMEPTYARAALIGSAEQMQLVREHLRSCIKRAAKIGKVKVSAATVRTITRHWERDEFSMPLYHLRIDGYTGAGFYPS